MHKNYLRYLYFFKFDQLRTSLYVSSAKTEDIEYLKWLHQKASKNWRQGKEPYLAAFKRTIEEIQKEQGN